MSGNAQKTPFAETINRFAEKKVADAIALRGKALPASVTAVSGSIVTVKFEIDAAPFTLPEVTMPIAGPEWSRPPTQIGDKGVVFPADVSIGNVTGLGDGVPDWSMPAPLSALTFFPVGNKKFSATDDVNAYVIYGPNGAILRTVSKKAVVTVSETSIVANYNGKKFTLNDTGLTVDCDLIVNGKITNTGDVSLGGGAKKVALDGDAVVGGVIVASSTKTKAT